VASKNLVTSDKHTVRIRPDILVRDEMGQVQRVGDAKWKLGKPSNSDFYQLTSYQLAFDAPGILFYPEQDGDIASENVVTGGYPLHLVEVPTRHAGESLGWDRYVNGVEEHTRDAFNNIC
jgi:5-methylcytosine-specific restriction enzyme subunit McrC